MQNDRLALPILLLLLTVLVPSLGVVWMMREAVRNEQLASSQRLREAYQTQLEVAGKSLQEQWQQRFDQLAGKTNLAAPSTTFAKLSQANFFDSLVLLDSTGQAVYPSQAGPADLEPVVMGRDWSVAEKLEFAEQEYLAAELTYAVVVTKAEDPIVQCRARQAQVRCLLKLNNHQAAIEVLRVQRKQTTQNTDGRLFAATAELQLVKLLPAESSEREEVLESLVGRLNDYSTASMPSAQRRFLMEAVLETLQTIPEEQMPSPPLFPTLTAERLAAEWQARVDVPEVSVQLQPSQLDGVWQQKSLDGQLIGLFKIDTLRQRLFGFTEKFPLPPGVAFSVVAPGEANLSLMETLLSDVLGRWRLQLVATDGDPFVESSQQRRAVHVWIAVLVVAVAFVSAWLLATTLRQRLRLAQLKNDLVATVSHELKTPLASIRLLVDTLLAGEADNDVTKGQSANQGQTREYLQLISQENARLTRLIDSFLTFSRMERGRQRFSFEEVEVTHVIEQAAEVAREHMPELDDCLQVTAEESLTIAGDKDMLVTAIVNLLENAWKYSDPPRMIHLSASAETDQVVIAVRDNGLGLSPRAANRVFDRFYQVDQRVARSQGGCGLGLSIVQGIVEAHQGSVAVESQLGKGSSFSIRLPSSNLQEEGE